jgi:membrane associated rhomboid family serine protease
MGIYDRDYYRREGPSFLGAITNTGQVCKWLIVLNVVLFIIQMVTQPSERVRRVERDGHISIVTESARAESPVTEALDLDAEKVLHGQVWRLLTHAFLHAGLLHILFNMLFLWWFGSDMEDLYGSKEFLAFYLVAALVGGLAFVGADQAGLQRGVGLGASGAVTAVLVLCACHYPTRTILFFFLPIPIWVFVAFQMAKDFLGFLGVSSGVGWSAHLGGAAFGLLYYHFQWRMMNLWPDLRAWRRARSRPRLRVYREDDSQAPVSVAAPAVPEVDEQLEAKMDAILEKVKDHGMSSLTESERQVLQRASAAIRRRRR